MFYLYENGKFLMKSKSMSNCVEGMLFFRADNEEFFCRQIVESYSIKLPNGKRKTFREKVIEGTYENGKFTIKNFMNGSVIG